MASSIFQALYILFCIFTIVHSDTSLDIPKCHPDDVTCIGRFLTKIIRHRHEYPAIRMPDLDLYKPPNSWTVRTLDLDLPVNFDGVWSNISFYGFSNVVIQQFNLPYHTSMHKDLMPIQFEKTMKGKIFIPNLELITSFNSEITILAWPMDAEGVLTFNMTDVDIRAKVDCDVIQRKGKKYVDIKSVRTLMSVSHSIQHIKYDNIGPFITHFSNQILESNWKELYESIKPDLEKHISNIIKSVIGPILDEIPITEFTYEQTELEMNRPIEPVPQNLNGSSTITTTTNNSSGSSCSDLIQKLSFSLLAWSLLLSARNSA